MKDALKTFGKNLKEARVDFGISQEELAYQAGFDRTYISLLERGLRNPPLLTIRDFANLLKTNVAVLTKGI